MATKRTSDLELEALRRRIERAERWVANHEQHGQFDTAAHEELRQLRARLAEGESSNGKSNSPK